MQPNEYQGTVVKRESPVTPELLVRLNNVENDLTNLLREYHHLALKLDAYKKHIFYGKALEVKDTPVAVCIVSPRMLHAILGIATEGAELIPHLAGQDVKGCRKEIGDVQWYVALAAASIDYLLEDAMIDNDAKLEARYKDKFSEKAAQNHDGK